ncbi:hypothetical protein PanWU01x14_294890, partial [Parasponia andersonii]
SEKEKWQERLRLRLRHRCQAPPPSPKSRNVFYSTGVTVGCKIDEWKDPSDQALSGGRGML